MKIHSLTLLFSIGINLCISAQWSGSNPVVTKSSVGIGTDYSGTGYLNPVEKLTVGELGGNIAVQDRRTKLTGFYTSGYKFYDYDGESASILLEHNAYFGNYVRALKISVNGEEKLRIKANGNVGIGVDNPSTKLDVSGNTYISNASIGRSGRNYDEFGYNVGFTNTNDSYTYRANDYATSIRMGWNGAIEFRTAPSGTMGNQLTLTERMRISLDGKVGIGTSNPQNLLDVKGTIHAQEVKVDLTSWSDFVFHPSYQLKPLSEVEKYIRANGHLENIPSEAEVINNGVAMGEMQSKLLQKVEELTLYIIEQNKKIEALDKENKILQQKLTGIETEIQKKKN